jgi:5,10-methylene-tetrahydrofolate dehydrogenase/methenyl tetrahydrofolate cyclohydrolase
MTIAMLMANTVVAAARAAGHPEIGAELLAG